MADLMDGRALTEGERKRVIADFYTAERKTREARTGHPEDPGADEISWTQAARREEEPRQDTDILLHRLIERFLRNSLDNRHLRCVPLNTKP